MQSFIGKGKGSGPSSGISISKPKSSAVSRVKRMESIMEVYFCKANSLDLVKDIHERSSAQGDSDTADYLLVTDSEKTKAKSRI